MQKQSRTSPRQIVVAARILKKDVFLPRGKFVFNSRFSSSGLGCFGLIGFDLVNFFHLSGFVSQFKTKEQLQDLNKPV